MTAASILGRAAELIEDQSADPRRAWRKAARPEQLMPPDPWRIWLLMGGRGSGKTRSGAQALAEMILSDDEPGEWAIVAPTYRDAWSTCVEGESGILVACGSSIAKVKAGDCPVIQSAARGYAEIRFRNGQLLRADSADDGALRIQGKNLKAVWCVVETTSILTDHGIKYIRDMHPGDLVLTRDGYHAVQEAVQTGWDVPVLEITTANGTTLQCTPDHLIWADGRGWVQACQLSRGDRLSMAPQPGETGAGAASTGFRADITTPEMTFSHPGCTWPSGNGHMTRPSRTGTSSITSTMIRTTTTSATSSSWCTAIMTGSTAETKSGHHGSWTRSELASRSPGNDVSTGYSPVSGAMRSSRPDQLIAQCCTAPSSVPSTPGWELPHGSGSRFHATSAGRSSCPRTGGLRSAPSPAALSGTVAAIRLAGRANVWDLKIEDAREFYANGILVHNCDEIGLFHNWETAWDESIAYAVRKGASKIIATGTPKVSRPAARLLRRLIKESKEDPTVIVQRLMTRDNLGNLSETFFKSVVAHSSGTKLERQELEGELLDDNEDALWTRDIIENNRVAPDKVPDLVRIVVALDPAVTSLTSSDETGIIVAGQDARGHGYVLADYSMRASPQKCMQKAVHAYTTWNADRVIGEANNGGDFIGDLLRAVDPDVPYSKVVASRGKAVRAEPSSALYEEGRVHHAGVFMELEDEMVSWVPGDGSSPDRLDALVWALTSLKGLSRGSWAEAFGAVTCRGCERVYMGESKSACPYCGRAKDAEDAWAQAEVS
jgi:phage terminase large subunit-like protein